ncbi:type VII secretion target [Micromonospora sp. NPDC023737]|uniref:type VII secretion target n=1 Tax=unclassified Micromonospora TaxID=2617518 RepID=UPI0033F6E38A
MAEEPFTVRPEALRETARALGDDAYRLAHGLAGTPGLTVAAPGWSTAAALGALEAAVHGWFGRLGGRVAETAGSVRASVDAYRDVDDRAARRLATVPR